MIPTAPLLTAVALLLGACGNESTAPGTDAGSEPPRAFAIVPGAAVAAKTATIRASHKLPIVSARGLRAAGFSASQAAPPVSSPFDLTYFGGAVVNTATSYNV